MEAPDLVVPEGHLAAAVGVSADPRPDRAVVPGLGMAELVDGDDGPVEELFPPVQGADADAVPDGDLECRGLGVRLAAAARLDRDRFAPAGPDRARAHEERERGDLGIALGYDDRAIVGIRPAVIVPVVDQAVERGFQVPPQVESSARRVGFDPGGGVRPAERIGGDRLPRLDRWPTVFRDRPVLG